MNVRLTGRIDSGNAAGWEQKLREETEGKAGAPVILDAEELNYISSAGLRVLLRLKRTNPDLTIINVCPEVYEILDMTGFTELMNVEKAYRVVSVEGCEVIGHGANGTIYRLDQDTVVKVYKNPDALDDIKHEREVARLALILGIPTAISYDVVRVGNSYGSVFEMLNARSFSKILVTEPEKLDWCVQEFVQMFKKIHSTLVPAGKLPDMRETVLSWASFLQPYLPREAGEKLLSLVEAVPHNDHMLHGDYHTQNLQLQNDEVLLIDMDTLAVGHPIFELGSVFNSFVGFYEYDLDIIKEFQGYDYRMGRAFWHKFLVSYLGTNCETKLNEVADKARIVGYSRLIRRSIRRKGLETETGREEIGLWKGELIALLEKTDTLLYNLNDLDIEAVPENLSQVQIFVEEKLEAEDCPPKILMQIGVAVEEIFVNIAHYAYAPENGSARVRIEISGEPLSVEITFIDHGIPYDPLAREDPDVTLPAHARGIGGLGIFMTKKMMDDVAYEYRDGRNILTLKKQLV